MRTAIFLSYPTPDQSFLSPEWTGIIGKWEYYVRSVVEKKSSPPELY